MIFSIFWLFIAAFSPLVQSSSPISFDDEQKKIMSKYIELNSIHGPIAYFGSCKNIKECLPVELMMDFDPIKFLQKMQMNGGSYIFMTAFWYTFDSNRFFICPPEIPR
jgi:hypothetical protein